MASSLYSQKSFGVWGRTYTFYKTHKTIWFYKEYYKNTQGCKLNIASAFSTNDTLFFIIGDTSCEGEKRSYLVIKDSLKYMMDTAQFYNTLEIEDELIKSKNNYPEISVREKLAIKYIPQVLDELAEEQEKRKVENENREKKKIDSITLVREKELDSLKKIMDNYLSIYSKKNLVLWQWSFGYSSEYSKFVDVSLNLINPYKKKIKYVWFTFRAYNPVGDIVRDGINGKTEKIVRGIGPIEYSEHADYKFESVFYSNVIETMKITTIKIQFFDGTFKLINNPIEIKKEEQNPEDMLDEILEKYKL